MSNPSTSAPVPSTVTESKVYLVAANNTTPLVSFNERKLMNKRPEQASNLSVAGVPTRWNMQSDLLFSNMIEYTYASLKKEGLNTFKTFYPVFKDVTPFAYIHAPVGNFKLNSMSEDQTAELNTMGLEYDTPGKLWRGIPQAHHLGRIMQMGAHNPRQVPGQANTDGFFAYIYALKAMRIFSYISSGTHASTVTVASKDMTGRGSIVDCDMGAKSMYVACGEGHPRTRVIDVPGGGTDFKLLCFPPEGIFLPIQNMTGIPDMSIQPDHIYNDNYDGYICPYFTGMMLPDREFGHQVFQRFFFRGLASTPHGAQEIWERIKSGLRNISMLSSGMALSHAFLGMLMADQSKMAIRYLHRGGIYHGFILQGAGNILLANKIVPIAKATDIKRDLPTLLGMDKDIRELLAVLNAVTKTDGTVRYKLTIEVAKSSRALYRFLREVDTDYFSGPAVLEIDKITDRMVFGETYASVNKETILNVLNFISTGDSTVLNTYPIYFTPGLWRSASRIHVALSIFGPFAPSFSFGDLKKGTHINIPEDGKEDTNGTAGGALTTLPYIMKPISVAVSQMTNMLAKQVIILPTATKKNKKDTNYDLRGISGTFSGTAFPVIYGKIKTVANEHRSANKGKRKAGLSDEGPSIKKKKVASQLLEDDTMMEI